ncbi:hypothetical protein QZH41_018372 [Actinostola sp. cb2023]|nr:hypothetical protein QZH41_018372 [Actinostola sp. cb2023]
MEEANSHLCNNPSKCSNNHTNSLDNPTNNLDNPPNNLDNPTNNLDNPPNNLDNPTNNLDNLTNSQDNHINNLDNPTNNLDNPTNNLANLINSHHHNSINNGHRLNNTSNHHNNILSNHHNRDNLGSHTNNPNNNIDSRHHSSINNNNNLHNNSRINNHNSINNNNHGSLTNNHHSNKDMVNNSSPTKANNHKDLEGLHNLHQAMAEAPSETMSRMSISSQGQNTVPLSANYIPIHSPNQGVFQHCVTFRVDMYSKFKERFEDETTKQLVGTIVLTRYNNKTYRIDDIEWKKNPLGTFTSHTGEQMTYVDYYKKAYGIEIKDHGQPLLVHRPKKRDSDRERPGRPSLEIICLIPELCSMTGLTDTIRKDFRVMKDISAHTRVGPMQRLDAMKKFIQNIDSTPEALEQLSNWGLRLDQNVLQTEGRLLPTEQIRFLNSSCSAGNEADWGREATRQKVISSVDLHSWIVLFVKRDQSKAFEYVSMMKQVTPVMGINVQDPQMIEVRDDRTETYLRNIRENLHPRVQVVVIIFPTSRDDRYAAVKKLCCVESPVPSQVINARTISQQNKLRSVTQKIALQINVKLGGTLWGVDIPSKSLMVVGIDVYHDAARGGRSVGGVVCSINQSLTRWYSRVCFQSPGQELMDGLKMALTASLKKYHEVNNTLPQRIVVFRDGVGDGQLKIVSGYEVEQISECFALFGEAYVPKMTVIVVQKRINTRLFLSEGRGPQSRLTNPSPGTVLDHTITRKDWYDFFLVSQHVRQGTVTPTHYVVVHDTSKWKPDIIQKLAYKLTHLYYNWPGTVSVPAPCQYAHKLAFLVGQSIHAEPSHDLSDRLFFL